MNIYHEMFRGLDKAQIKAKLALVSRVIYGAFGSYEAFVATLENSEVGLSPDELLACAKWREANSDWPPTKLYRRYAEVGGNRDEFYAHLLRRHHLLDLREHFPERVTPKLLKEFGWFWFEEALANHVHGFNPAYEAFRDAGYKRGMVEIRRAAIDCCDLGFIKRYGIALGSREKSWIARDLAENARGNEPADVCRFLVENGFTRHYRRFLETASLSETRYSTYLYFSEILGVESTTEFLEEELYPVVENEADKFDLCSELHRRNPRKWEKELKMLAARRRMRSLECGEPVKADKMAKICDTPLTVEELLGIHARYILDERLVMRTKAVQALDMATKIVAKQAGAAKPKKAKAA